MALPAISLAVVGAAHRNEDGTDREAEIAVCEPGEPIHLIPEPENRFDRHAIAVYSCRGVQIGYISAERAPRIGALLESEDVQSVFQRPTSFGAWIRVAFDGQVPALLPAMLEEGDGPTGHSDVEKDFYPDEVWPDD